MGVPEIEAFLTHLAVVENVAASTQNQAFTVYLVSDLATSAPTSIHLHDQSPYHLSLIPNHVLSIERHTSFIGIGLPLRFNPNRVRA